MCVKKKSIPNVFQVVTHLDLERTWQNKRVIYRVITLWCDDRRTVHDFLFIRWSKNGTEIVFSKLYDIKSDNMTDIGSALVLSLLNFYLGETFLFVLYQSFWLFELIYCL